MDTATAIQQLARAEARRIRPIIDAEELNELDAKVGRPIPAISVVRGPPSAERFKAIPLARDPHHDNADRLGFLVDFLNHGVLPLVDPEADVSGTYRFELHDSYTYLPNRSAYQDVFSFGRALDAHERRVALFPDPYHIAGFGQLLDHAQADAVPWADKEPVLFFAGTTTGDRDPLKNARIRACVWSLERPDIAVMRITKIAQMQAHAALRAQPQLANVLRQHVPVEEHWRYRYQVNIVGNTACWSRLPMVMSSRSVMVHVRHSDVTWYYPLIREGRHFVGADSVGGADLTRAHSYCKTYDRRCRAIVEEANALARDLFVPAAAAAYAAELLQECAYVGGR